MSEWIVCTDWTRFQHYDPEKRQPPWIKNYTDLLHNDDYLDLSAHQRAVLHGIWLTYASARCQLRLNTSSLSRRLGLRVMRRDIEALVHAGFLEIHASAVHALRYPSRAGVETEAETDTEEPLPIPNPDLHHAASNGHIKVVGGDEEAIPL